MAVIEAAEFAGTKTWAENSAWVGGAIPTENDDVVFGEKSGTVEVAAEGKARSVKSTATYKGTLKVAAATTLKVGAATVNATNVIWEWLGGTFTAATTTAQVTFGSSSATQVKIYCNLSTFGALKFTGKGSYILEQKLSTAAAATTTIEECTFASNGQECSLGFFNSSNALTRTVNIENSIVKVAATGTVWTMSTKTNLTFKAAGSTIELTDTGAVAKTFVPGSEQKYNKIKFGGGASAPKYKIGTSCTINILEFTEAQKATFEVTSGVKLTVEKVIGHGASGKLITMEASTPGTAFEFASLIGTTFAGLDWISFKDCHVMATSTWYAGANSTNVSGNENLKFESFKHPHTFEVTQAQTTSRQTEPARKLTVTQAQTLTRTTTMARALSLTQGQSVTWTRIRATSHSLSVAQGQAVARITRPERTLAVAQGQAASQTFANAKTLVLVVTQLQSLQRAQVLTRVFSVSQPQVVTRTRTTATSRTLALEQPASVSRTTAVARTLSAAQGQAASLTAKISLPPHVLEVAQAQAVTLAQTLTRAFTLSVTQATTLALTRAPARTLAISQGTAPTLSRTPSKTLRVSQGQTVARTGIKAAALTLTASQGQAAHVTRGVGRLLAISASQTTTFTGALVLTLLPPFDMVAGVSQPRDESGASAGTTIVSGVETSESKASVIG